jgi:thioredoxin 2
MVCPLCDLRYLKVDTEAEKNLAARFQIRSIPMLFCKGSSPNKGSSQRAGALDRTSLRTWLASLPAA